MSQHESDHMERIRQEEARAGHQEEVEAALADRDGPQQEDDAPDAETGPVADEDQGEKKSLLQHDLGEILEERKNYQPDPEVQEALQGLRAIPVREALDDT